VKPRFLLRPRDRRLALLDKHKDDARVLAGGQSLVPMMNFRVASPKVLVDVNRIAALSGIKVTKTHVRIGALARHVELERSPDIAKHLPLVASAMPHIAHPAIRNRGTFGGSCALADPAAELPACAIALGATFVIAGKRRAAHRRAGLLLGLYAPRSRPVKSSSPRNFRVKARLRLAFELAPSATSPWWDRRADRRKAEILRHARVALGVGDRPARAAQFERALDGEPAAAASIESALARLDADLDPRPDLHASAAMKRHLAKVLVGRVLKGLEGVAA
jgi:carbon-monoxide dehydrogenase medium subunit